MTEKIGVTYLSVMLGTWHMALFYENSAGERRVIEAAPLYNQSQLSPSTMFGEFVKEWIGPGNTNTGSPFGFIVGGDRPWSEASPINDHLRPSEVVMTGDDLSATWGALTAAATEAFALHYEYRPLEQNSNTLVTTLLDDAGLPQPTRHILDSNGQWTGEYYDTPAYEFRLHDPLVNTSLIPLPLDASEFTFFNPTIDSSIVFVNGSGSDPVDITFQWVDGTINVSANGVNVLSEVDIPVSNVEDTNPAITGINGHVVLVGHSTDDTFDGHGADCLMLGGPGNDTFLLGYGGPNWINGGSGSNTADYTRTNDWLYVTLSKTNGALGGGEPIIKIQDLTAGGIDTLVAVDTIRLGGGSNTVFVQSLANKLPPQPIKIDVGAANRDSGTTLNFSDFNSSVYLISKGAPTAELYKNSAFTIKTGYSFSNFNNLVLSSRDDNVTITSAAAPYLKALFTGSGQDVVWSDVTNVTMNIAPQVTDTTRVDFAGSGTVINVGKGKATISLSDNVLVANADANDVITSKGGYGLHGALGRVGQESAWVTGWDGTSYGLTQSGDLLIKSSDAIMTVSNYRGGPSVPFAEQTAGIYIGLVEINVERLLDLERPFNETIDDTFKVGNAIIYTLTGKTFFKADPLVLDLNGDGINLLPESAGSPVFDINNTGFGVHTGWVQQDDGMLVLDSNTNGQVDSARELFGGPGEMGFAALGQHDANNDDIIDALDDVYDQLQVWRDINGDAKVNAGELQSLAQVGITSINLIAAPQTGVNNAGNAVTDVGSFTWANGSTGAINGVSFTNDPFHSQYLGDTTVSPEASALPNLKGFGTLTDLHVAMTLDPDLIDVVTDNLPNLNTLDLASLRAAAMPIFSAWAHAVRLPDANGVLQVVPEGTHSDIALLVSDVNAAEPDIVDFAYRFTDENDNTYWKLASGDDVLDSQNNVITQPTFEDIFNQQPASGSWEVFSGAEIAFMERYIGQPLPIDVPFEQPAALLEAMSSFIEASWTAMNLQAVRLAMQGPLASYFSGIAYDVTTNTFSATTDQQLSPVYDAIFAAAPADPAAAASWLAQWKPILDVVLGDFSRGEGREVTYGYMFASMVRSYETIGLPLSITDAAEALGVPSDLVVAASTATVTGTAEADIFYLSNGNQTAQGGAGLDNYVLGANFGQVTIDDLEAPSSAQDPDILRFATFSSTDVTATRNGIDLVLTINATGQQVIVVGQFIGVKPGFTGGNLNDDRGVAEIVFLDGVVWSAPDIARAVSHPQATDDVMVGTAAIDVLDGGLGTDTLTGGDSGDIYIFGTGYGVDAIEDNQDWILNDAPDYLKFGPGLSRDDVTFQRDGNSDDLQITINGTSDVATVIGQFAAYYTGPFGQQWFDRIEGFLFEDSSYYNWKNVIENIVANAKTEGADTIYGFAYEDILDGGAGNDTLVGGNENDIYIFGLGYGTDIVHDVADNILGGMTDKIVFNDDVLLENIVFTRDGSTEDLLITLSTGEVLRVQEQFEAFSSGPFGTIWFDRIESFEFADETVLTYNQVMDLTLAAAKTTGDDTIYGFFREDVLDGGAGNDRLEGGNEGDTYIWGRGWGNDVVHDFSDGIPAGADIDAIAFSADVLPADVLLSRVGAGDDLILTVADTGETLIIEGQFAKGTVGWIFGQIEEFRFADQTVWTAADIRDQLVAQAKTSGDDDIYGFYLNEVLDGGAGNDYLEGQGGGDTYVFGAGYGQDVINAYIVYVTRDFTDVVEFKADIAVEDVRLSRSGDDLILTISGTDDQLTIEDHFNGLGYYRIEEFRFADEDETVWTWEDIQVRMLTGTPGDDTLVGFVTADYLDGGAGNDRLEGNGGGDTFVFGLGYGSDVIDAYIGQINYNQPDTVEFGDGITSSMLTLSRDGDDLVIGVTGTSDQLRIEDQFNGLGYSRVENFAFANGSGWTWEDVQDQLLVGTSGNDVLIGYTSDDVLDGGAGNDFLKGRQGDDTYVFGRSYGTDTIFDDNQSVIGDAPDRIAFGADIAVEDLEFERSGDDLIIRIAGTSDSLTVQDHYFTTYFQISYFEFADQTVLTAADVETIIAGSTPGVPTHVGTSGDDTIDGTSGIDVIDGLGGNDTLRGADGSDTYLFGIGSGNDLVDEQGSSGDQDLLRLMALNPNDVELSRLGNDLVVRILSTSETVTVDDHFAGTTTGIEQLKFTNGTIWDRAAIQANAIITGTSGAETLDGDSGANALDGLGGIDLLRGSSGNDTYLHRSGSGNDTVYDSGSSGDTDTLRLLGIASSGVTLLRSGDYDLLVERTDSGEIIKVEYQWLSSSYGLEKILFDDGSFWDRSYIMANAMIRGTAAGETINGTSAADIIDGLGGDDTVIGGDGGDQYLYRLGSGNDIIRDYSFHSGTDTLRLAGLNIADVIFTRSGNDLFVKITSSGEQVNVYGQFSGNGVEQVKFADNTIWDRTQIAAASWIRGTSAGETLNGTSDADQLDGAGGNDLVIGGDGGDTYLYAVGSGDDTVRDQSFYSGTDVLLLSGLNIADVMFTRSGNDLFVKIVSSGEQVKVESQFSGSGVEQVKFADNTTWDRTQILDASWIRGTSAGETITGTGDADKIDGGGGNDTINGGNGADTLDGGSGNDTLNGQAGGDTYLYGAGSGNDTIAENTDGSAVDKVKLVGLNIADVSFGRTGDNLLITITASGEQLTVQNHFSSTTNGIEQLIFADNTTWSRTDILLQVPAIAGTSGNDTLNGTSGDNAFNGGLGNDTIRSGGGSDLHLYASGDGSDLIDEESGSNSEVDTLWFTDINAADITLTRAGAHMKVDITATGHQLTIDEQYFSSSSNWGIEQIRFANGTVWNRDTIMQNSWWNGTSGNDNLSGWASYDNIDGGAGNDTINGNAGIDKIVGGSGDDTLTGGAANDRFIFKSGFGLDTITDFTAGAASDDVIEIQDGLFADFAAVQAASAQVGSNVVITLDASNTITLQNVTLANLHQDDFHLV